MTDIQFPLEGEFIELCKLLKAAGLCESGGEAKYVISQSLVRVNGEIELRKGCKIRSGTRVEYNGQTLAVN
jgi:ribosome-associated protein